mgnify:CR=1 FL=1
MEGDAQYIITALEKDGEDLHVWKVTFLKKLSASHILSLVRWRYSSIECNKVAHSLARHALLLDQESFG